MKTTTQYQKVNNLYLCALEQLSNYRKIEILYQKMLRPPSAEVTQVIAKRKAQCERLERKMREMGHKITEAPLFENKSWEDIAVYVYDLEFGKWAQHQQQLPLSEAKEIRLGYIRANVNPLLVKIVRHKMDIVAIEDTELSEG